MIGDVIAAVLPMLRDNAESLMTDAVKIERDAGTTWDEDAQASVTVWVVVHASMPCAIDIPPVSARSLVTDEVVTRESPVVRGPVSFTGIEPDDRVTVTAAGPLSDAEVGSVFWVTQVESDTHAVERVIQARWVR